MTTREISKSNSILFAFPRFPREHLGAALALLDISLIFLASQSIVFLSTKLRPTSELDSVQYAGLACLFASIFVPTSQACRLYDILSLDDLRRHIQKLTLVASAAGLLIVVAIFTLKIAVSAALPDLLIPIAIVTTTIAGGHALAGFMHSSSRRDLFFSPRRVLLVSFDGSVSQVVTDQALARSGFAPVQRILIPSATTTRQDAERLGRKIAAACRLHELEEIIVIAPWRRSLSIARMLPIFHSLPLRVHLIADPLTIDILRSPTQNLGDLLALELTAAPLTRTERFIKRTLDILISATLLIILFPLLVAVAALIKLDSPGPALFVQTRLGFNGKPFSIFKFRSMRVMEDGPTIRQATLGDDRVTRVGKWIRRSSIDELPQLWNVLRGEMSLVGPRPHATAHDIDFEAKVANYALRQHLKPGLTGWAQINGSRGETPTLESIEIRLRYDLWYLSNASVLLDLKILALTAIRICDTKHVH
jgi:Undecaprenyl-phosphate glucose phosphotransferase